ncbi:MAG: DUF4760 domain-containing protein [Pseudomonadota bacterium]
MSTDYKRALYIGATALGLIVFGALVAAGGDLLSALVDDDPYNTKLKFQAVSTIATGVTAFAIIGTVIIAQVAYETTSQNESKTAKIQKTIDFISRQVHDKDLIDMLAASRAIKHRFTEAKEDLTYQNVQAYEEAIQQSLRESGMTGQPRKSIGNQIHNLLNYYETWSVGIENGALDEDLLKDWWKTTYTRDWARYKPFIEGHRDAANHPKAYRKFQQLAETWASEDQ